MSDFAVSSGTPDTTKHVSFTSGMVPRVEDFAQEFIYQSERDHLLARELIGHGTVAGLALSVQHAEDPAAAQVRVSPGTAVLPDGEFVRVFEENHLPLSEFLPAVPGQSGAGEQPAPPVRVYVLLRYRAVYSDYTDDPEAGSRAHYARVVDMHALRLSRTPPIDREEGRIRQLVSWLQGIALGDDTPASPVSSIEEVLAELRLVAADFDSPGKRAAAPVAEDSGGGPPAKKLKIPAQGRKDYWRAVFKVWTTELRALRPAAEADILLGTVLVSPGPAQGSATAPSFTLEEQSRPCLLNLRLLQEWVLAGGPEPRPGPVSAGVVRFTKVAAGQVYRSKPIRHRLPDPDRVLIRLELLEAGDGAMPLADPFSAPAAPRLAARHARGADAFVIWLRGPATAGPDEYRVRWHALPVTDNDEAEEDAAAEPVPSPEVPSSQ